MAVYPRGLTGRLTSTSARHPWRTIAAWLIILVVALIAATGLGDALTTEASFTNNPESQKGSELIQDRLRAEEPLTETLVVSSPAYQVDDPEFQTFVDGLVADLRAKPEIVESVVSFYEAGEQSLVSEDRSTLVVPVSMVGTLEEAEPQFPAYMSVVEATDAVSDFDVATGGDLSVSHIFSHTAERDLQTGELIGLPIALLVLVLVFGALIVAGVPIVLAVFAILVSLGVTALIGRAFELSFFVINMIFMIGLAVGIDYSLFIVGRYREERQLVGDKISAMTRAGDTASKAVLFSGLTVVAALMGMLLVPTTIFSSLGTGAIIVVIVSVLATLTLLPAVVVLMGSWVDKGRLPFFQSARSGDDRSGFWAAIARGIMGWPVTSLVVTVLLLAALSTAYFTIDLGQSGLSSLPRDSTAYRAFTTLDRQFPEASLEAPMDVVVDAGDVATGDVMSAVASFQQTLSQDPMFGPSAVETNQSGDLVVISAPIAADTQSSEAIEAIHRVRDTYVANAFGGVDAGVYVTGPTAETIDFTSLVETYTPIVFAFVLAISFLLLTLAFRSIVIPIKAILMNLLSVGASYGLLVLVFQHGFGNEIFGFQQVESIESWVPLMMFTILFGLSMDYHVFLLSRIRERFDQTGNNFESVAYGVRSTARIITGAALIMVAVFGGFAMGELTMFQQLGFGLAVAVILDATIIRSVLVPASMVLLGDRNWYFPSWLQWLPNISVEGEPGDVVTPAPTIAGGSD